MPATEHRRELRSEISLSNTQEENGGLLIRNARLLAVGLWTDSQARTPVFYPSNVLKENATNWIDNSYWSRHQGGVPRRITEKVGVVLNPRFEGDAVVGDILLHGKTLESKDTIAYIKWAQGQGIRVFTSVEHGGDETWNEVERRYELTSLYLTGAAVVNVGACSTCALPRENGGTSMDIKELEAALKAATDKIAALEVKATTAETKVKELEAKITPPTQSPGEDPKVKELEAKLVDQAKASDAKIKELEAAIKKLEETPNPQTRQTGQEPRELEPPAAVHVDPKSGEVYGL